MMTMIDQDLIDATREYLRDNGELDGLEAHLEDRGFEVSPEKIRLVLTEMLREDGYTMADIKRALSNLDL